MLTTNENAFRKLGISLESSGEKIEQVIDLNNSKHRMIITNQGRYYCLFKRNFFLSFANQFPSQKGMGESINVENLRYAIDHKCMLIFIYDNGNIYKIPPLLLKNYAEKYDLIRRTKTEEVTYSIPINFLERLE